MSKLPQDAELAFGQARALYTPSPERLAQLQARIARAVESGASASVDVPQALFVPSSRAMRHPRFRLHYWMVLGAFAVVLGAALPREAPPTGEVASSPQLAAAAVMPSALQAVPEALLERETEPLEATQAEPSEAPVARARVAEKRRRAQSAESPAAAPAAIATQAEDLFGAAFDFLTPAMPIEPAEPQPRPSDGQSTFGEPSAVVTASGVAASPGRLAAEVKLIAQAKKAIVRGELERAQLLLSQHRRDFPGGQLLAERVALEVRARCKAGDVVGAEQLMQELASLAPDSLLSRSAMQKCGE